MRVPNHSAEGGKGLIAPEEADKEGHHGAAGQGCEKDQTQDFPKGGQGKQASPLQEDVGLTEGQGHQGDGQADEEGADEIGPGQGFPGYRGSVEVPVCAAAPVFHHDAEGSQGGRGGGDGQKPCHNPAVHEEAGPGDLGHPLGHHIT